MTPAELQDILSRWNLTQEEAADFLGYSRATVNRWLNEERAIPAGIALALRIMLAYDLTPARVTKRLATPAVRAINPEDVR